MVVAAPLAGQITERLKDEEVVWIAASLDDYWDVVAELANAPYDIEYFNGRIRAKMSQASDNHETIVANIIRILGVAYYTQPDIRVMGSNKLVYVPPCSLSVNPDVLVMKGESQLFPRPGLARPGLPAGITNPYILIEVHSYSTEKNDFTVKLRCYKQIESVRHIVYIDQHVPNVSVYTRQQDAHHWLNEDYDTLDMIVGLDDLTIPMQDIYHKVVLTRDTNA